MTHHTHNTDTVSVLRERFEAAYGPKESFAWRNPDGSYKVASLQQAWEIWQQAAFTERAAIQPAGDAGCALRGGKCACPTSCEMNMAAARTAPPVCTPVQAAPDVEEALPCKLGGGCMCNTEHDGISEGCKYYVAPAVQTAPDAWLSSIQQIICDLPIPAEKEARRQGFVDCKMAILDALRVAPAVQAAPVSQDKPKPGECHDAMAFGVKMDAYLAAPEVKQASELPEAEAVQRWKSAHGYGNQTTVGALADLLERSQGRKPSAASIGDDAEFKERLYRYADAFVADAEKDESYSFSNAKRDRLVAYIDAMLLAARSPVAAPQPDVSARDAVLESMLEARGSDKCPLCGNVGFHTHTPNEIIIFGNGIKWERRNEKHIGADNQGAAQNAETDARATGQPDGNWPGQPDADRARQSGADNGEPGGDSSSARVSGAVSIQAENVGGQLTAPESAEPSAVGLETRHPSGFSYGVCRDCGAEGPCEDHSSSAEDCWNRRAAMQTAEPVDNRRCKPCASVRGGDHCWKCGTETFTPDPRCGEEPRLPPIDRIRELAKEVGYAIGVHVSQQRDFDVIAAPWSDSAIGNHALLQHIAAGLTTENGPARIISTERKPLGRYAATIQMDGWYKQLDISVCPNEQYAAPDRAPSIAPVEDDPIVIIKRGFEGSKIVHDPTGLGSEIHLWYQSGPEAEASMEAIQSLIEGSASAPSIDSAADASSLGAMAIGPDRDGKTPYLYAPMDDLSEIGKALHAWRNRSKESADSAADVKRYKVEKLSGSEYARVIDTKTGATVKKWSIFKRNGWETAVRCAEHLNKQAIAALQPEGQSHG